MSATETTPATTEPTLERVLTILHNVDQCWTPMCPPPTGRSR